jgi:hypothetical protein
MLLVPLSTTLLPSYSEFGIAEVEWLASVISLRTTTISILEAVRAASLLPVYCTGTFLPTSRSRWRQRFNILATNIRHELEAYSDEVF